MKINEKYWLPPSIPLFIVPKYIINSDCYRYWVDFKLFKLKAEFPSIHWWKITPFCCWQLETLAVLRTRWAKTVSGNIGITQDYKLKCPKQCTEASLTSNSLSFFVRDRVFPALIYTEQERVGRELSDNIIIWWGFPFSCCEAPKDEILGGFYDRKSPSFLIALTMEIEILPPICLSIINPLESSTRKLVSNKFDDHLTMGGSPKGLGCSKICWGVILQSRSGKDNLRNRYFRNFLRF
jgi:hypothetical protein